MAYDFDGTDDGISLGNGSDLNPTAFTISLFANLDSIHGGTGENWLFNRDQDPNPRSFAFGFSTGAVTNKLVLQINGTNRPIGATDVTTGTWHHLAGGGQSGSWAVYLNGVSDGTDSTVVTPNATAIATTIGHRFGGASAAGFTDGRIAEVGFWNAVLTASEIAALAKAVSPLLIRPENLIAYVPLVRDLINFVGVTPTLVDAPAPAAHPRIIMPRRRRGAARALAPPPPETLFAQACL